jgi:hypothetical protein
MTHCTHGCGGNVHISCVLEWGRHAVSSGEKVVRCPLCRAEMGSLGDIERIARRGAGKEARKVDSRVHRDASCRGCSDNPVAGILYRCDVCTGFELCHGCYTNGAIHPPHTFSQKRTPRSRWEPAVTAPLLPAPMVRRLESGEIGDDTYDLLLQLDRNASAEATPLPPRALARLSVDHVTATLFDEQCGICNAGYTSGDRRRRLPCAHYFHIACIDPWFQHRNTCPIDGSCAHVQAQPAAPPPAARRAEAAHSRRSEQGQHPAVQMPPIGRVPSRCVGRGSPRACALRPPGRLVAFRSPHSTVGSTGPLALGCPFGLGDRAALGLALSRSARLTTNETPRAPRRETGSISTVLRGLLPILSVDGLGGGGRSQPGRLPARPQLPNTRDQPSITTLPLPCAPAVRGGVRRPLAVGRLKSRLPAPRRGDLKIRLDGSTLHG